MKPIALVKHLILRCLDPLERRGIQFTMRRKIVPPAVLRDITEYRKRSFCPFAHFDTAWRAMRHIEENSILGDIVMCGVATGGLARFMALHLPVHRRLWLYDTFDGGSLPGEKDTEHDRSIGEHCKRVMATDFKEVERYVSDGCLHQDALRWVVGDIMKTIPERMPKKIALLYLDTDWYESTAHELRHLEPLVSPGGIIIQDDMGLCLGAARAVHEYYAMRTPRPYIAAIDEAGCQWQKI